MVAALLVFGLVIDYRALYLNLTGREVALEVLHISRCVPKTPLLEAEQLKLLYLIGGVGQRQFLDLGPGLKGNKEEHLCGDTVLSALNGGIVHTVTALVEVKRSLAGFPAGIPYGVTVLYVEVPAARIHRHTVITVACDAAELGILAETVAACRI